MEVATVAIERLNILQKKRIANQKVTRKVVDIPRKEQPMQEGEVRPSMDIDLTFSAGLPSGQEKRL
ncbi:hypothetical protein K0M31_007031 [Melipona bicolor]|uniref:Uncharacterized protein n=1 Tax=Melipona bicolor TaxID=60889 RepID=A0AA40KL18_9HYME|nr:hypothetical protein K0M31_007031 [Melipona bicolor]